MNGYHAELFTYCLYKELKAQSEEFEKLRLSYEEVMDSSSEPFILLKYKPQDKELEFKLYHEAGYFLINAVKGDCEAISGLDEVLIGAGFVEIDELFQVKVKRPEINALLRDFDQILARVMN